MELSFQVSGKGAENLIELVTRDWGRGFPGCEKKGLLG